MCLLTLLRCWCLITLQWWMYLLTLLRFWFLLTLLQWMYLLTLLRRWCLLTLRTGLAQAVLVAPHEDERSTWMRA